MWSMRLWMTQPPCRFCTMLVHKIWQSVVQFWKKWLNYNNNWFPIKNAFRDYAFLSYKEIDAGSNHRCIIHFTSSWTVDRGSGQSWWLALGCWARSSLAGRKSHSDPRNWRRRRERRRRRNPWSDPPCTWWLRCSAWSACSWAPGSQTKSKKDNKTQ